MASSTIISDSVPVPNREWWFRFHFSPLQLPAALFGLSVGLCCFVCLPDTFAEEPTAEQVLEAFEKKLVEVIARTEKSVVAIARIRKREGLAFDDEAFLQPDTDFLAQSPTRPDFIPYEFGSGVVVGENGLILTTYHVLGEVERSEYVVWWNQRPFTAKVKAADPWLDIAVLEIKAQELTPIQFGNTQSLKKGQLVIGLGNPQGIARDGRASASWGAIANLERSAPLAPGATVRGGRDSLHQFGTLIQTDLRTPVGCSGGALLNLQGEMIGLTTTFTGLPLQDSAAGMAIPTDKNFLQALEKLKQGKQPEYGFLGFAPGLLDIADRQAGKPGVVVEEVVPGTPAAQAGLTPGMICTHIDDIPIRDDLHLIRLVSSVPARSEIRIAVQPVEGPSQSLTATLSKRRLDNSRTAIATVPATTWRGLTVEECTALPHFRELSPFLDVAGCVGVLEVERNSSAWKAGLRSGQLISFVQNQRVASPAAFHLIVQNQSGQVSLRIIAPRERERDIVVEAP